MEWKEEDRGKKKGKIKWRKDKIEAENKFKKK